MLLRFLVVLAGVSVTVASHAAPSQGLGEVNASLRIRVEADGSAALTLEVPAELARVRDFSAAFAFGSLCDADADADAGTEPQPTEEHVAITTRCASFVEQVGFSYYRRVRFTNLDIFLSARGVDYLEVVVEHPRSGSDRCSRHHLSFWLGSTPQRFEIRFGYGLTKLGGIFLPPLLFYALLVAGLRVGTRRRGSEKGDEASRRFQGLRWAKTLGYVGWPLVVAWSLALDRFGFLSHIEPPIVKSLVATVVYLGGPLLIAATCTLVSHAWLREMSPELKTIHRQHFFMGSFLSDSTWAIPLGLVLLGLSVAASSPRTACVAWLAAFALRQWLADWWSRMTRPPTSTLVRGELYERIHALARTMSVPLDGIFIAHAGARTVSAAEARPDTLQISDRAVASLEKKQLDAVVAHELSHMRHLDPMWLGLATHVGTVLVVAATFTLWPHGRWPSEWLPVALTAGLGGGYLGYLSLRRRAELRSDREALETTNDPEALASSLVAVTRDSGAPLEWGRWDALTLSHPPTLERVEAFRASTHSDASTLAAGTADRTEGVRYEISGDSMNDKELVFSSELRRRVRERKSWWLTAVFVVIPPLVVWAGGAVVLALVAASVTTLLLAFGVERWLGSVGIEAREPAIRAKLGIEGGSLVAFEPCPGRSFEGFEAWDVGVLNLEPHSLSFVGEKSKFALSKNRILRLSECARRGKRTLVVFRDDDRAGEREIVFDAIGPTPMTAPLRRWLEEASARDDSGESPVPNPCAGAMPSGIAVAAATESAGWVAVLGALTTGALGLGWGGWSAVGVAVGTYLFHVKRAGLRRPSHSQVTVT